MTSVIIRVLDTRKRELKTLERNPATLEKVIEAPFARMTYDDAARS